MIFSAYLIIIAASLEIYAAPQDSTASKLIVRPRVNKSPVHRKSSSLLLEKIGGHRKRQQEDNKKIPDHLDQFGKLTRDSNVPDHVNSSSESSNDLSLYNDVFDNWGHSMVHFYNNPEATIEEKLDAFADIVKNGGEKVVNKSVNYIQKKSSGVMNTAIDLFGDALGKAVKNRLKSLMQNSKMDNKTISILTKSVENFVKGTKELLKNETRILVEANSKVLNESGVNLVRDSLKVFKDTVMSHSNILIEIVPSLISGALDGDMDEMYSLLKILIREIFQSSKVTANGLKGTLDNTAMTLSKGAVSSTIDTTQRVVGMLVNKALDGAKSQGADKKIVDKFRAVVNKAMSRLADKTKIMANHAIDIGFTVKNNEFYKRESKLRPRMLKDADDKMLL